MYHIRDFEYHGHEVIILCDGDQYICDIRADDYDGELIAGFTGFNTEAEAIMHALATIDAY